MAPAILWTAALWAPYGASSQRQFLVARRLYLVSRAWNSAFFNDLAESRTLYTIRCTLELLLKDNFAIKTGILLALRGIFVIIAILNFGKFRVRRAAF